MKRESLKRVTLLAVLFVFILTGCGIPSVHPLYEKDDLILEEKLTGTWESESGESTYTVMSVKELKEIVENNDQEMVSGILDDIEIKGLENLYFVQQLEEPDKVYLAGLVEMGNGHYIDFTILDIDTDVFRFPVHIFLKATIEENELRFDSFKEEWLMELIQNRQVRISHEVNQFDRFLLTAKTDGLQKFVEKYGDMEEGIGNSFTYRKISPNAEFIFEETEESTDVDTETE